MACLVTVLFVVWKIFHKNLLGVYYISALLFIVIFTYIFIRIPPGLSRFWLAVRVIYILTYTVTATNYENPDCNCFYRQKIKLWYHIISYHISQCVTDPHVSGNIVINCVADPQMQEMKATNSYESYGCQLR